MVNGARLLFVGSFISANLLLKPGSHTSIGDCKTKNVIELVSRELPVKHNTRCLTNISNSY